MTLLKDVRYAARLLVKDKWFTLVAVRAGPRRQQRGFTFVNAVLIPAPPPHDNCSDLSKGGRLTSDREGAFR
jgi:hypothetical protein